MGRVMCVKKLLQYMLGREFTACCLLHSNLRVCLHTCSNPTVLSEVISDVLLNSKKRVSYTAFIRRLKARTRALTTE